jgi:hypothetical protein
MRSSELTYGSFLRAIRDQPGLLWKLAMFLAFTAALGIGKGSEYALMLAGYGLAAVFTLGYPVWRWIARRRGRPYKRPRTHGRRLPRTPRRATYDSFGSFVLPSEPWGFDQQSSAAYKFDPQLPEVSI